MRMFLVGMCDIFLILYLTTLSQVNQNKTSHLTVDDYNKAKEEETLAKEEAEKTKIEEKNPQILNSLVILTVFYWALWVSTSLIMHLAK